MKLKDLKSILSVKDKDSLSIAVGYTRKDMIVKATYDELGKYLNLNVVKLVITEKGASLTLLDA